MASAAAPADPSAGFEVTARQDAALSYRFAASRSQAVAAAAIDPEPEP
jgi:hypothetical protein